MDMVKLYLASGHPPRLMDLSVRINPGGERYDRSGTVRSNCDSAPRSTTGTDGCLLLFPLGHQLGIRAAHNEPGSHSREVRSWGTVRKLQMPIPVLFPEATPLTLAIPWYQKRVEISGSHRQVRRLRLMSFAIVQQARQEHVEAQGDPPFRVILFALVEAEAPPPHITKCFFLSPKANPLCAVHRRCSNAIGGVFYRPEASPGGPIAVSSRMFVWFGKRLRASLCHCLRQSQHHRQSASLWDIRFAPLRLGNCCVSAFAKISACI
ncbi:uncharacterized protein EI97DRAFT_162821 [Westerdykella ornata]|uniref:Uncharacterized protein n=1 Tax=Westerdykella ornata TaxID=318751 RepID=A0A6A6J9C4_WESOR|nr:uncharacterized protein EI97DRAFT_162821 [Westerdykella ornata]KAF2273171.1 hypothetical protein EI97DRAFT_162821 [Westerdykella ornata]